MATGCACGMSRSCSAGSIRVPRPWHNTRAMPDCASPRQVTLKVRRSDPELGQKPSWQEYRVPLLEKLTVLDALFHVVYNLDSTLSFRCACRAAMCGSCGMVINGREGLACRT